MDRLLLLGVDAYKLASSPLLLEFDDSRNHREERIVRTAPDVKPRLELGASLTNENLAAVDRLSAEPLNSESLGIGIPSVSRAAYTLLVRHTTSLMIIRSSVVPVDPTNRSIRSERQ
jgi:hypothetical protein